MSVKKDEAAGTRSVEIEFEVPGSPEEVWRAIATGPGISAWFVPTEVAEREGGEIAFDLGPGVGESKGVVTAWEPPRRFAYEEREWMPGAPPVATELHVEARGGGTCVVRMVHSLFTDSDEWDDHLEGFENGWPPYLHVLDGYFRHHAGQRCRQVRTAGQLAGTGDDAWSALAEGLGLAELSEGDRAESSAPGAPPLAGVMELRGTADGQHYAVLRTEAPAPGFAILAGFAWGGTAHVSVGLYLYGEPGEAAAVGQEAAWHAWMTERFPPSE